MDIVTLAAGTELLAQAAGGPRAAFQEIYAAFSVVLGIAAIACFFGGKLGKLGAIVVIWIVGSMIAYTPEAGLKNIGEGLGSIAGWIADRF